MVEAKAAHLKNQRRFLDQLFAAQTANLMNIQGRFLKKLISVKECTAFDWEEKPEMTDDEALEAFDRSMGSWALASKEMSHG